MRRTTGTWPGYDVSRRPLGGRAGLSGGRLKGARKLPCGKDLRTGGVRINGHWPDGWAILERPNAGPGMRRMVNAGGYVMRSSAGKA